MPKRVGEKNMSKDKSMEDGDWNAWTADVRTWLSEVDTHMANSLNAGMDEDMVEEMIEDIQKNLNRGDKRDTRRQINKQHIQDAGRDLAGWPKIRGGGSQLPPEVQGTKITVLAGFENAFNAYYEALEEAGLAHYEVTRASKKDGGTDGGAYDSKETFVKAKLASQNQTLTRDYTNGLWAGLNTSDLVMRPYTGNDTPVDEEDSAEDSE